MVIVVVMVHGVCVESGCRAGFVPVSLLRLRLFASTLTHRVCIHPGKCIGVSQRLSASVCICIVNL